MSKQTAWAHLPNAHHIDRILVGFEVRPRVWGATRNPTWDAAWKAASDAVRDVARGAAWDALQYAAWDAARNAARVAAWRAGWDATWDATWEAIRGAVLALIAWDDAGVILDMPTDAVRLLAASGHHPAVLLLPAAVALATTL